MRAYFSHVADNWVVSGVAAAIALAGNASPSQAQPVLASIMPLTVQMAQEMYCNRFAMPTRAAPSGATVAGYDQPSSKSAAILGGAPSMLERIRLQQSGLAPSIAEQSNGLTLVGSNVAKPLQPALGGANSGPVACTASSLQPEGASHFAGTTRNEPKFGGIPSPQHSRGEFLASKRIEIGRTNFDAEWSRVRYQSLSSKQLRQYAGSGRSDRVSLIATVNREVNHRIRYVEDSQLFGKADYWAGARTTLRLGKGDCEDIALAKMQLLAAAGVPRKDMILTITRDLVRNADHAVLIVRHEGDYLLLDNSTDKVLDARYGYDYRPVLSFSEGHTWLHGY